MYEGEEKSEKNKKIKLMGYNCKQNVWRWKKIKKGKLNGLQLTVVDSVGLGLGNSMHFKKKKKKKDWLT